MRTGNYADPYRLPRRSGEEILVAKVRKETGGKPPKYKGKVLVMDDEEILRSILCVMLFAFGYEASVAADGEEAIRAYSSAMNSGHPFDVVIMDLHVPGGMGGAETIRRLTQIDREVRAVVCSGFDDDPALVNYIEHGFVGALKKPYSIAELRQVLQDQIPRRTAATTNLSS
jgi:CheY-like chemotaxis protein